MKKQLAMVIDSSLCIDCKGCMTACKVENKVPPGMWRNWIKQQDPDFENLYHLENTGSMHFQPGNCMHCDNPTCVQACPTSALNFGDTYDPNSKVSKMVGQSPRQFRLLEELGTEPSVYYLKGSASNVGD